LSFALFKQVGL